MRVRREELHAAAGGGPARQAGRVAEPDPEVRRERVRAVDASVTHSHTCATLWPQR